MSERIEPALSAESWRGVRSYEANYGARGRCEAYGDWVDTEAGMIAAYNDLLPDSDPRKITREKLAQVRAALAQQHVDLSNDQWMTPEVRALATLLEALESYLPPEGA